MTPQKKTKKQNQTEKKQLCVGVSTPAAPDPSYDRREELAKSFAGEYKLLCVGSAYYDTPPPPPPAGPAPAAPPASLPRCIGIELLVAAQREAERLPAGAAAAAAAAGGGGARASALPPLPAPPRSRPLADRPARAAAGGSAPGTSGAAAPSPFTAALDAAGVGGDGAGPLGRFARKFAARADGNLGRMRDALGFVAAKAGLGGGGGEKDGRGEKGGGGGGGSARRPPEPPAPPRPPAAPPSSSPPPPPSSRGAGSGGGGGGGGNSGGGAGR